jgi:hypothetical protein
MAKSLSKSKDKQKSEPKRPRRRVLIFGAGVSASCGIAVAKDILREAVGHLAQQDADKADRIHKVLKYLYPGFKRPALNYPNIEDFLNLLEMAKLFNSEEFIKSDLWPKEKLEEVEHVTLKAVTDYIWGRMVALQGLGAMRAFVRDFVRANDTLITFNWDLSRLPILKSVALLEGACDSLQAHVTFEVGHFKIAVLIADFNEHSFPVFRHRKFLCPHHHPAQPGLQLLCDLLQVALPIVPQT